MPFTSNAAGVAPAASNTTVNCAGHVAQEALGVGAALVDVDARRREALAA